MKTLQQVFCAALALCLSGWASADSYEYDKLNRLTLVTYTSGGTQRYSYDPAGNLLELVSTPPAVSDYPLLVERQGLGGGTVTVAGIDCGTHCLTNVANGTVITITAAPHAGSTFSGWGGACSGAALTCNLTVTTASNVTATFDTVVPTVFTLGVQASGGTVRSSPAGIVCRDSCSGGFSGTVTLTATPDAGQVFSGWSGDCSGQTTCVLSMTADRSVSAIFLPDTNHGGDLTVPFVLAKGWNLVGNSLTTPVLVATALNDPAVVNTVWKWNAHQGSWLFYSPALDAAALQAYATSKNYGVLGEISPGEGYWVNAKAAATLATQIGTGYSLKPNDLLKGWNLVATGNAAPPTPSEFNRSLGDAPPAPGVVPLNLTTLWAWDSVLSNWFFYAPALEANGGLGAYTTGKGYLDFMATGKALDNGMGFWVNMP